MVLHGMIQEMLFMFNIIYDRGSLPNLDYLLIRTIGINMPSKMSDDIRDKMKSDLLNTLDYFFKSNSY